MLLFAYTGSLCNGFFPRKVCNVRQKHAGSLNYLFEWAYRNAHSFAKCTFCSEKQDVTDVLPVDWFVISPLPTFAGFAGDRRFLFASTTSTRISCPCRRRNNNEFRLKGWNLNDRPPDGRVHGCKLCDYYSYIGIGYSTDTDDTNETTRQFWRSHGRSVIGEYFCKDLFCFFWAEPKVIRWFRSTLGTIELLWSLELTSQSLSPSAK